MIVPASSGLMGILPSHAPTVAQLRSGVVEIHNGEGKESYFVSSGFAFIHKDRTDVCAIEAVKVSYRLPLIDTIDLINMPNMLQLRHCELTSWEEPTYFAWVWY